MEEALLETGLSERQEAAEEVGFCPHRQRTGRLGSLRVRVLARLTRPLTWNLLPSWLFRGGHSRVPLLELTPEGAREDLTLRTNLRPARLLTLRSDPPSARRGPRAAGAALEGGPACWWPLPSSERASGVTV